MTAFLKNRAVFALCCLVAILIAVAIYRPWVDRGFDIQDFSEFLTILRTEDDAPAKFRELVTYYESHGRWNATVYVALVLKWQLLGEHVAAWQWLRFVHLVGICALLFALLRRLGIGSWNALAGALLFLFSAGTAAAATRLTLSEPLAIGLLLLGLLIALEYQTSQRWKVRAVVLAGICALIVAGKEILVVLIPAIVAAAILRRGRLWIPPDASRRNIVLVGAVAIATVVIAIPIALAFGHAKGNAYAAGYDGGAVTSTGIILRAWLAAIPVQHSVGVEIAGPMHAGNLLLVLVIAGAFAAARRHERPLLAMTVVVPAVTAGVIYSPWPRFEEFYAQPFFLGTAAALSWALELTRRSGRGAWLLSLAIAGIGVALVAANAFNATSLRFARRGLDNRIAMRIAAQPLRSSVVVETRSGSGSWQDMAATLERAARLRVPHGRVAPVASDRCVSVATAEVVISTMECEPTDGGALVVERYTVVDWLSLRFRTDSLWYRVTAGRVRPDS